MKYNSKIIAGIMTFGILVMLILSGPVGAFNLDLSLNNDKVTQGKTIKFTASIEMGSSERVDIDYLKLVIDGPTSETCKFNVNGNKISSCKGITKINLISNSATYGYGYGYGYGYTNGKLVYEITLDTDDYKRGDYETELQIYSNGDLTSKQGPDFTIKKKSGGSGGGPSISSSDTQTSGEKGSAGGVISLSPKKSSQKKSSHLSENLMQYVQYQLFNFPFVWMFIFLNLVTIELIGIALVFRR